MWMYRLRLLAFMAASRMVTPAYKGGQSLT
jgi:hypothetical protein